MNARSHPSCQLLILFSRSIEVVVDFVINPEMIKKPILGICILGVGHCEVKKILFWIACVLLLAL